MSALDEAGDFLGRQACAGRDDRVVELDSGDDPDSESGDGRTLRRRRNRAAVVQALIDLINGGDMDPTIAKVAERSGVSERSIFRYFTDLNDLARTAIDEELRTVLPVLLASPLGTDSPLTARVESFVDERIRILGRTARLSRVARYKSVEIPEVDRQLSTTARLALDRFGALFEPELAVFADEERTTMVHALVAAFSFDAYEAQHRYLDRSDDEIAESWRLLLLAALR